MLINNTPSRKEGDVLSIKISNGEEIVCRFISETDSEMLVDRPVVLQAGPKGQPALMPYFMTVAPDSTKRIAINKAVIVMSAATDTPLAQQYTSALSGIQMAPAGFRV
jgi:hypothetical protein